MSLINYKSNWKIFICYKNCLFSFIERNLLIKLCGILYVRNDIIECINWNLIIFKLNIINILKYKLIFIEGKTNYVKNNKFKIEKQERKFYTSCLYNDNGYVFMKIYEMLGKFYKIGKLTLQIQRWQWHFRKYSSTDGFEYYNMLKNGIIDKDNKTLNKFLVDNFSHLQFMEYEIVSKDLVRMVAFQYTDNYNPVQYLGGKPIPVFEIEKGTYMCFQGIEFVISRKDVLKIFKDNNYNYNNISQDIKENTPEIIKDYMNKGWLSVFNIQTGEEKPIRNFQVSIYKSLEEFKSEISNEIIKMDKKDI